MSLPEPQPSGYLHFDPREQAELSKFIKSCNLAHKNVKTYKEQYEICADKNELSPQWWQTSYGVGGIFILGLITGALVVK